MSFVSKALASDAFIQFFMEKNMHDSENKVRDVFDVKELLSVISHRKYTFTFDYPISVVFLT